MLAFLRWRQALGGFCHAVLRGLHRMQVVENGRRRPLLDELSYIAAVSGGSFPAMRYGLFRDRSFETFPDEFLKRDINAHRWGMFLLPWNGNG